MSSYKLEAGYRAVRAVPVQESSLLDPPDSSVPELYGEKSCSQKLKEFSFYGEKSETLSYERVGVRRGAATPATPENHMASV